jgi:serine/threonine protein phosphatase PrpC
MISQPSDQPEARIELASRSDVGQVRSANEDSCDAAERADGTRLLVVADGMGGHRGGATASRTAVAAISEVFDQDTSNNIEELIQRAIKTANTRVYEMAQANSELEGMGTTIVAFLLDARHRATVAHVGDSRAYRYRKGHLEPLTIDHSVVAEMHRRGLISAEEAASHPRKNEILRSVGVLPEVDIEVAAVGVAPGDRFVLCSDGLSDVMTEDEIAAVVESETPASAVDVLVRMANDRGGPDNITVQVLSIPANAAADDPEATATVELSEAGINLIESNRRETKRIRRIVTMALALLLVTGAYFLWQLLEPTATSGASSPPEASQLAPTPAPGPEVDARAPEDRFEGDRESPRRGIPR